MENDSNRSRLRFLSTKDKPFSKSFWTSDTVIMTVMPILYFVLLLVVIRRFGYFRDELYYIACSDHPAFGYVDHPPLAMLLLKFVRMILGDSLLALRLLPALSGAAFVYLTGRIARELGGNRFAILLATTAAMAPIGNLFLFHIYSMNFLDLLFWQALILIVIRIIKTGNPRYWLLFGLVAGLGLQNKISILILCFGIVAGLLLTPFRKYLAGKHLWLGGVTAGLLFLPYILWNMSNDWAHLEFIRNARAFKMAAVSPLEFLKGQILYNNPATLVLWLAGLGFFFFYRPARKYRIFGWMFLTIFVLFTVQQAKDYYFAGGYPILFAGGAVLIGTWIQSRGWKWIKPVLIAFILLPTLFLSPFTLPILSVEQTIVFHDFLGMSPGTSERKEIGLLSQHYADQFGWPEMVAAVDEAFQKLSPEEQRECFIYVRNYGQAGAIDFFGEAHGLPRAACSHNSYWLWGPGDVSTEVGIIFGVSHDVEESLEDLRPYFESVELGAVFTCTYCMPYENNRPIIICRGMKASLRDLWAREKHYN
jgi:hypothetical protein